MPKLSQLPNNVYKCVMGFRSVVEGGGFSELYYIHNTDVDAAIATATVFAPLRLALSPRDINLDFVRVSFYNGMVGRKVDYYVDLASVMWSTLGSYVHGSPDDAFSLPLDTALLLREELFAGVHNTHWIRGLPSNLWLKTTGWTPDMAWSTAFDSYVTAWKGDFRGMYRDTATPRVWHESAIFNVIPRYVRERKAGRPFGGFRGRKFAHRKTLI